MSILCAILFFAQVGNQPASSAHEVHPAVDVAQSTSHTKSPGQASNKADSSAETSTYDRKFWIEFVIGFLGLGFSILAFWEAKQAKAAAIEAGRSVKLQTVVAELSEVLHELGTLSVDISYDDARNMLRSVNRRLRRQLAFFSGDIKFGPEITKVYESLEQANLGLKGIEETIRDAKGDETVTAGLAFYAVDGHFLTVSNHVSQLIGLFENKSINSN